MEYGNSCSISEVSAYCRCYQTIARVVGLSMIWYDMIYVTAIGLTPGGSSTVHIYTLTIHEQHNGHKTIHRTT